ncbi:MAG: dihydrofolate reductase family protein [Patescibacteria group bacterium]|jgi:dihydrofolate reductase
MRKIVTTTFITLDGVMQAPGGPDEDKASGFAFGGWQAPFVDGELMKTMGEWLGQPFELLLGRKTYDIFAAYWPSNTSVPVVAEPFNATRKYVVSHNPDFKPTWNNSVVVSGDVAAEIAKLKAMEGKDLWVHGSGSLIQTLLKHQLIDRMHLWIHPLTIGSGKKLFEQGTQPATWKLVEAKIGTSGIILATYEPAGPLETGTVGT